MHRIAKTLGLDPLDVIRRNLVPKEAFPYRAASGSLLDSGDYATALDVATGDGRLDRLRARRDAAWAEGRRYGIGFAAVVEPSISNMGYITMALTPEERERTGPKDGARRAPPSPSILSAPSPCKQIPFRRARATAPCSPRSLPTFWAWGSKTSP